MDQIRPRLKIDVHKPEWLWLLKNKQILDVTIHEDCVEIELVDDMALFLYLSDDESILNIRSIDD